ncbi:hypothetical protein [Acidovorax sp. NCPPB 4044]|uniref:hypothetical protein n=1 Tax=Acidovorax sp. NCPPB 4044 TaxID=2940490 RepID=UPI0023040843|nr:hypothetical protein [Acidovorax sp. NCPPB 4044]MDA8522522.1 hypothetical protein [Acidovorax sp. NCPPB 4044]
MTSPAPLLPGAPEGATRTAWWLFAPPAALMGLRWLLEWHGDRWPGPHAWALAPFAGTRDPGLGFAALGAGAAAIAAVGVLLRWTARRRGRPHARRVAAGLWALACVGGALAMAARHWDARWLQPLPEARVSVAGSRVQPPSLRGPGGTQVVLRWEDADPVASGTPPLEGTAPVLRQATLPASAAAAWRPGQALRLQWARGRFGGLYATGWQPLAAGGTAPAAPHLP